MTGHTSSESFPPSHFAKLGNPSCSIWGKSEIEWLALAYVQALANDGDTWKPLTRERTLELLPEVNQGGGVYALLKFDHYQHWFDLVSQQITDAEGAFGVRGFWGKPYNRTDETRLAGGSHVD